MDGRKEEGWNCTILDNVNFVIVKKLQYNLFQTFIDSDIFFTQKFLDIVSVQ